MTPARHRLPSVDEWETEQDDRRRRQQSIADAEFNAGWWTAYDAEAEDEFPADASGAFQAGYEAGWGSRP